MEYAFELKFFDKNIFKNKFTRIYFGDSFCHNAIPSKNDIKEFCKTAKDNDIKITYNTPYVTDKTIKRILENVSLLCEHIKDFELVFNDWGVFYEIKKNFPAVNLVLGRLLTKQRTDPNALHIITNTQKPNLKNNAFPKKVPKSLYKHFQGSVINDKIFQEYLAENKINRVELEYLLWPMKISLPKEIKASVYFPYAHITTTRNCGILNMTYAKCSRICRDIHTEYKDVDYPFPYTVIGNTVYYKLNNIDLKKYKNIDRIVFNDTDAYKDFTEKNEFGNK